jgi:hypothetical protein
MVLIETFAWSVSGQSVSPHAVRTWRACRKAIDGECVGGWNETYAASLTVAGAILMSRALPSWGRTDSCGDATRTSNFVSRFVDLAAQGSLAALGAVLLVGGATRSSLDESWQWVPVWLPLGIACLPAALQLRQWDRRRRDLDGTVARRGRDIHARRARCTARRPEARWPILRWSACSEALRVPSGAQLNSSARPLPDAAATTSVAWRQVSTCGAR